MKFPQSLQEKLDQRKADSLLRTLTLRQPNWIDFSSNDYLGIAQYPAFPELIEKEMQKVETSLVGSTGSRLISGNSAYAEILEQELALFHKAEAGLIFNSGYDANCGMFACLAGKGDTYISDELIHASLIDGEIELCAKIPIQA